MDTIHQWLSDTSISVLNRFLPFLLILLAGVIIIRVLTKLVSKMLTDAYQGLRKQFLMEG